MVKVFAPVNIAWVKYMGKASGYPTNASLSMTLESLGTETKIAWVSSQAKYEFDFEGSPYVPPRAGLEKIQKFLSDIQRFEKVLNQFGFECASKPGLYRIWTQNNVPAGTGIATSASGFAALTLAWLGILSGNRYLEWIKCYRTRDDIRAEVADLARLGSGSACRSFHGPFVEWTEDNRVFPIQGPGFIDFVLVFETEVKKVSSSEAHERVKASPLFPGRRDRVRDRLSIIKDSLRSEDLITLSQAVLQEAIDMHELFHTSDPPFRYFNSHSEFWISRSDQMNFPTPHPIITADAGANIHLFIPEAQEQLWDQYLQMRFPELQFLKSKVGRGADYLEH